MNRYRLLIVIIILIAVCPACKHEPVVPDKAPADDGYPVEISRIVQTSCVDGCHNAANYTASGGNLLMDSWEHLFNGGAHGAAVIPYSISNSPLLYFINDTLSADTRMPYQRPALSKDDYTTIKNWIAQGAPDNNGNIPFADNAATRQKIYVLHSSCNGIAVIDAGKQVIMRYVPVGKNYIAEQGHSIKVSADGRYVYASFYNGNYIQKIDAMTDTVVAELNTGHANWQMMSVSPDNQQLAVTEWRNQTVTLINTNTMQMSGSYTGFSQPYGLAFGQNPDTIYVTAQNGNMVYKAYAGGIKTYSLERGKTAIPYPAGSETLPEPHQIVFTPDHSKYFVSCQKTNEVRVMDAHTDELIDSLKVGAFPQEMAISAKRPYIFVTCMEDEAGEKRKGSVYAINYETLATQKITGRFYEPHGITVDDQNGKIYVISRNTSKSGIPPHHGSGSVFCSGNNGFYTILDLNTFEEVNGRLNELTVDPYAADVRFK